MDQQLIDRIYECAFAPEFWPGMLDDLAQIADARGGHLFSANTKVECWTASASLRGGMEIFVSHDLYTRSQRPPKATFIRPDLPRWSNSRGLLEAGGWGTRARAGS